VIGFLSPGYVRVVVGENVGLLDTHEASWPIEWVPETARRPNGEFAISGFRDGIPDVIDDQERCR
jgi:hypothetical protein